MDAAILECSPFLQRLWYTGSLKLDQRTDWDALVPAGDWVQRVAAAVPLSVDEVQFKRQLRHVRQFEQARFVYRELGNQATLSERMLELSAFADACVQRALQWLESSMGICGLIVFALGKLGGRELNLSSDIDLIFACADGLDLTRMIVLAQRLLQFLHALTEDGQVFRVDMRLRPWGEGSALVSTVSALEAYYEQHGRDWERYAWIKARVIADYQNEGTVLLQRLRPFVYRRYLDVAAVHSLSTMKALIEREERRRTEVNIKTGYGGIREVEFVVQAFQLLRAGMDRELQTPSILEAMAVLEQRNWLERDTVQQLRGDYVFLRRLEHAVQAQEDQQTQSLPQDPSTCLRVAQIMGFAGWDSFLLEFGAVQERVHLVFSAVITQPAEAVQAVDADFLDLWMGMFEAPAAWLSQRGVADADAFWQLVQALAHSRALRSLSGGARERLDRFLARLLVRVVELKLSLAVLQEVLNWVEAMASRSVYLLLVDQAPQGIEQLLYLATLSPWIMEHMRRYPAVTEEVLISPVWQQVPDPLALRIQVRDMLLRLPEADSEETLRVLRVFQKQHAVQLARAEREGALSTQQVSQALTQLAEVLLERVAIRATAVLTQRYGVPPTGESSFMVIAYGKLGSCEMGYASDLDLVFVYSGSGQDRTLGESSLDISTFFVRLGQKMIHMLTAPMAEGVLYHVDMRLRPSGHSGLLVSSWRSYTQYQEQAAWTWEHQALVRARPVFGDPQLQQEFAQLRTSILGRQRVGREWADAVLGMREKMRLHHNDPSLLSSVGKQSIKHLKGGLVDIEFMVQYAVLRLAHTYPELSGCTHTGTLLDRLRELPHECATMAHCLKQAWLAYHAAQHALDLQAESAESAAVLLARWAQPVQEVWMQWFECI